MPGHGGHQGAVMPRCGSASRAAADLGLAPGSVCAPTPCSLSVLLRRRRCCYLGFANIQPQRQTEVEGVTGIQVQVCFQSFSVFKCV